MVKCCASLIAFLVRFALLCFRRCGRLKTHLRLAGFVFASLFIACAAYAQPSWTGATSADWNVNGNWTPATAPAAGATVKFDQNSLANLSTNNNIAGLSLAGIVNTSNGTTGPAGTVCSLCNTGAGAVSISGSPLTIGGTGILMGGALTVGFTSGAKVNMSINTDLTLSANQFWQAGGVGPTLTIGASAANTVNLNGFTPTIKNISQVNDLMVINSSLIGPGSVTFDRAGTVQINSRMRMRINGNSTYAGGTTINEHKQVLQIGSSSTATTGPFGTGPITFVSGSALTYLQPIDADRTISNNITLSGQLTVATWRPQGAAIGTGDPKHSLTLTGTITASGNPTIAADNGDDEATGVSDGSGDLIINGNVLMTNGVPAILTTGAAGNGSPSRQSGKIIYNGNILQTTGNVVGLTISNGSSAFPTTVRLNGQNTYVSTTTLSAPGATNATTDANLQIGSDSVLNGGGNIVSGPLGLGLLNAKGTDTSNPPRIEAVNGPHTVANGIVLTSSLIVQGSQDLTLTGVLTNSTGDTGGLTKSAAGKLTLTGTSDYVGATTVNGGTLLVNGALTQTSGVLVNAAGTLGGNGSITGAITNKGTLAPGAGVGTLSVTGNVTDGASSSWSIDLSGATSDLLAVSGDIDLSAVDALNVTGMGSGTSWTIGTYTGSLTGTFDTVTPGYSVAYTGGTITLNATAVILPGDFNSDGKVDASDYVTWRKNEVANAMLPNDNGVGNQAARYSLWRTNFGNPPGSGSGSGLGGSAPVPEPATMLLLLLGIAGGLSVRARRHS
jgi:autotransporter-associated beta strand protein